MNFLSFLTRRLKDQPTQSRRWPYDFRHTLWDRKTSNRLHSRTMNRRHNPRSDIRRLRLCRILRDELTQIFSRGEIKSYTPAIDDTFVRFITIVNIDINSDCSVAKVFVSTLGNAFEKRKMLVWLDDHRSQIQHLLQVQLRDFKRVPRVSFHLLDMSAWYLQNTLLQLENNRAATNDLQPTSNVTPNDDFDVYDM